MVLTLYIDHISEPSRAVHLFCLENNIPFQIHQLKIIKGLHKSDDAKSRNPNGQVPVIDDDGFHLWESHAILRYLARSRSTADHWYPKDPKAAALVDRYLDWHHTNLRSGATQYLVGKTLFPMFGIPAEAAELRVKKSLPILENSLKLIDTFFLEKTPFLAGEQISLADLAAVEEIVELDLIPFDLSPYPKVQAWIKRVQGTVKHWATVHEILDKAVANRSTLAGIVQVVS